MTGSRKITDRNRGVDLLRIVAVFMVVVIHCHPELMRLDSTLDLALVSLSRLGVGCFFVITGYYLPVLTGSGKVRGQLGKLLKIALWSAGIYFIYNLLFFYMTGSDVMPYLRHMFSLNSLACFIGVNSCRVEIHLWYLFAVAYVLVFMSLMQRYGTRRGTYIFAFVALVAGLIVDYTAHINLQRNWLFYGIPFTAAGMCVRDFYPRLRKIPVRRLAAVLAVGLAGVITEAVATGVHREFYILSIFNAVAALTIALRIDPIVRVDSVAARIADAGMKYSLYIYIFHLAVKRLLGELLGRMGVEPYSLGVLYPLLVFLLSLGVAFLWQRWRSRPF